MVSGETFVLLMQEYFFDHQHRVYIYTELLRALFYPNRTFVGIPSQDKWIAPQRQFFPYDKNKYRRRHNFAATPEVTTDLV